MYLCTLKMNDMDILELALHNQQTAWKVLEHTGIIRAWERIGATVHLVGSLKSGLLAKSRDIDLHIYTDTLDIAASFSVMQELAERLSLKEIHYNNLIQTEEECIEWHAGRCADSRHRNLPCCFRGWGSQLRRTGTMERNQSADK